MEPFNMKVSKHVLHVLIATFDTLMVHYRKSREQNSKCALQWHDDRLFLKLEAGQGLQYGIVLLSSHGNGG